MGWLDSIIKIGAPILGGVLGSAFPGVGTAFGAGIGGAISGGVDLYNANEAANDLKNQQNEAKAANIARYNQILDLYGKNHAQALGLNDQISNQDKIDIGRSFDDLNSNTMASLSARGLGNTTIVPTIQSGITRDRGAALAKANDESLQRKLRINADHTGALAGVMERRNDIAPSNADVAALAAAAGQAQNAIGGSLQKVIEEMQKRSAGGGAGGGGANLAPADTGAWLQNALPGYFGSARNAKNRVYLG